MCSPYRFYVLWLCLLTFQALNGQRNLVENSTIDRWPIINDSRLSNDGNFFIYEIDNGNGDFRDIVVGSTGSTWKFEFKRRIRGNFSFDSQKLIFLNEGDSLGILELGTDRLRYIPDVKNYSIPEYNVGFFEYQEKGKIDGICLFNFTDSTIKRYPRIIEAKFFDDGHHLLLTKTVGEDSLRKMEIQILDLYSNKIWTISHCWDPSNFTFDDAKKVFFFQKR